MAKIKRLDHIGIAVKNLDEAIERFTRILGAEFIARKEIVLSGSKMCVGYLRLGDTLIGLDQPAKPDEFLAQFIERRGEGLHHIGLEVEDLKAFQAIAKNPGVSATRFFSALGTYAEWFFRSWNGRKRGQTQSKRKSCVSTECWKNGKRMRRSPLKVDFNNQGGKPSASRPLMNEYLF